MYDLHAHILPGLDDGATSVKETVEMASIAAENGTTAILATPHRKDVAARIPVSHLENLVADMNGELSRAGVELKLQLGMENHLDLDLPEALSEGLALPMNDSRYALVELPFFGYPNYVEDVLFRLQVQEIVPVLAHPERIEAFQNNLDRLADFVERGMLSQVTAGSILGHFGTRVRRITHAMLRRGLVHVIASDTHAPHGPRSPLLPPGLEAAGRIVGEERARAMVVDTPRAILSDAPVEVAPPEADRVDRQWWRFWAR